MKTTIIASALAALVFGGVASAQPAGGGKSLTRAEFGVRADRQFARLDADSDGTVTAAELGARKQARRARSGRGGADGVARRFTRIDTDGNGAVTLAEMQAAHAKRGDKVARSGKRGRGGLARIDANGDDAVSRAEFQAQRLERFARLDGNRDGTVTPAERQGARQERRAR